MKSSKSIITRLTVETFWKSVNILLSKTHVVNKRLWGNKTLYKCSFKAKPEWILPTTCSQLEEVATDDNIEKLVSNIRNELNICSDETHDDEDANEIILSTLLPKTCISKQAYQLVCIQKDKYLVTFFNVTPTTQAQNLCPDFTYSIQLSNNEVIFTACSDENSKSYLWLVNTLMPQFIKWGEETINSKSMLCTESLGLVCKTKYYEKYNDLKVKYGKEMVKIWPECTDPSKFVYEDVAIAAYLLLIWEQDDTRKTKSFIDLGCGNGLLVYILAQEGHQGVGLDVRKRNIWDMYPSDVILQEKTITPSDASLFPDVDWIIGNHSDELTPWIPVITAKSSYKGNFFLLPCCAYNFDGSKYQRKNSYNSQYIDYLEYIKKLCEDCGFRVDMDRLKIPSTKRICLVSKGRMYSEEQFEEYCNKIDTIVNCGTVQDVGKDFKAREAVEKVRNCTQIDKNVINAIVNCISKYLLDGCSKSDINWSIGKTAAISELVQLIPNNQLAILKSECGGLQTLLKNNHHIFKVQSGKVELRYPKTTEEVNSNPKKRKLNQGTLKIQQKPCWFYSYHPQGCPLKDTDCSFLHVPS